LLTGTSAREGVFLSARFGFCDSKKVAFNQALRGLKRLFAGHGGGVDEAVQRLVGGWIHFSAYTADL
jgi:hypothetical protein